MGSFRLFTFIAVCVLLCEDATIYLSILLFLGWFPVLMIMNNAAVNINVPAFQSICLYISTVYIATLKNKFITVI